jgi:hypothetical protein
MADINVTEEIIDINVTEEVITIEAPTGAYPFPNAVFSVFGRVGSIVAAEGDYSLTQLSDVTLTSPANGQVLKYNGTSWVNSTDADTGITTLNTLTSLSQTFATGTSGTDFNISSASSTHTFNFPTASATNRGLLSSANWSNFNTAYNDSIISAAVTGTTTKTLTLNQQDGGTITASWTDTDTGLTSVGLSMPSAFSVANSPLTANGTLSVTGAGTTAQYIRGDGSLATFPSLTGYVPYTGATTNVNLGTHSLTAADLVINHASGSGVAASITKGGNGEALTVVKSSGSGNAASITGGVTLLSELNLTTDLADSYIASASNWNTAYNNSIISAAVTGTTTKTLTLTQQDAGTITASWTDDNTDAVTSVFGRTGAVVAQSGDYTTTQVTEGTNLYFTDARARAAISLTTTGTSGAATYSGGVLNIPQYQGVLTNPVTGTGTTNTLPKFTGASTIGNSNITDTGSLITLGSNSYVNGNLSIGTATIPFGEKLFIQGDASASSAVLTTSANSGISTLSVNVDRGLQGGVNIVADKTNQVARIQVTNSSLWDLIFQVRGADGINERMRISNTGSVGIGTTTLTGYTLRVAKNLTGSTTQRSIVADGLILSDVTSSALGVVGALATQAATFTLTNIFQFYSGQGTFGAGSVVTNQYGYFVESNLTGATNNYGFYGNIPAAANRWNLYMNGTANNYMAGSLGIGTTTIGASVHIKTALSTASSEEIALRVESTPTGGTPDRSIELSVKNDGTAANTYGILRMGSFATNANTPSTVVLSAGGDSFFRGGGLGIGTAAPSAGPITSITLTNGGSGYVDGTYTNISFTSTGESLYGRATYVVSGGVVTSATLTWGGSNYTAGQTLTTANTNLGGTGSGLVVTVATVDSSQFRIQSTSSTDISLFRYLISASANDSYGSIKWESNDSSEASSGIQAEIGAYAVGTLGGGYLSFFTRAGSLYAPLVEAMRIDSRGNIGIGATALTRTSLSVSKNITGSTLSIGIGSDGVIQSDVTSQAYYFISEAKTAAASFTLGNIYHYRATQGTFGAGSIVTSQTGFNVDNLTGATNNYGFFGNIASGTNRWNLYMNGTAANYMAGTLSIGTTSLTEFVNIANSTNGVTRVTTTNSNAGTSTQVQYQLSNGTHSAGFGLTGSAFTSSGVFLQGGAYLSSGNSAGGLLLNTGAAQPIYFGINNTERARLDVNGNFGVGTNASNNASAKVQVDSTTQGFLPPRMTTTQKTAIATPAAGLMVYDTTLNQMSYYNGTTWINF